MLGISWLTTCLYMFIVSGMAENVKKRTRTNSFPIRYTGMVLGLCRLLFAVDGGLTPP